MLRLLFHGLQIVRNKLDSRQGMEDNLEGFQFRWLKLCRFPYLDNPFFKPSKIKLILLLGTPTIQKDSSLNQHSHLHNLLLLEQRSYLHFQMGNIPWKSFSLIFNQLGLFYLNYFLCNVIFGCPITVFSKRSIIVIASNII